MAQLEDELVMQFKSEQQKAVLNVLFTANNLKQKDTSRLHPFGLSVQQYNILRILCGAKGRKMCMYEVLERMFDRAPNATRLTDKLIAKDLVMRERCEEDRRVVHVRITDQGLALLAAIETETCDVLNDLASKLTSAEAKALNTALDKMRS